MSELKADLVDCLKRAREGDEGALGELLGEYRPYLRILAERAMDGRLAARVDASDVIQQTYLSAVRRFDEFTGEDADALAGWLKVIHERNLIDTARKHLGADLRAVGREDAGASPKALAAEELTSPSQRLMQGESAVRLARELSSLPEDQAEAVRLRHLDGWSLDQIAEKMGRTKRSVANLLHRGLANLRERLKRADEDGLHATGRQQSDDGQR